MDDHDSAALISPEALAARGPVRIRNESAEYRAARTRLLAEEIALRRQLETVARMRRALPPGGLVDGDYRFEGEAGPSDFAGLFGDKLTLLVYSYMFGPQRERPCPMCTANLGALDANALDIQQNIALAVVARSPLEKLLAVGRERGWRALPLYSDLNANYSRDYQGLEPDGSESGVINVFTRRDGSIRHFWMGEITFDAADPGQDPRDQPELAPLWNVLDLTPEGRAPDWYPKLQY
jgi:predicted dithiol-disulfide oxidoreductase (DUF899 family)